jgi:hypothetical protein
LSVSLFLSLSLSLSLFLSHTHLHLEENARLDDSSRLKKNIKSPAMQPIIRSVILISRILGKSNFIFIVNT